MAKIYTQAHGRSSTTFRLTPVWKVELARALVALGTVLLITMTVIVIVLLAERVHLKEGNQNQCPPQADKRIATAPVATSSLTWTHHRRSTSQGVSHSLKYPPPHRNKQKIQPLVMTSSADTWQKESSTFLTKKTPSERYFSSTKALTKTLQKLQSPSQIASTHLNHQTKAIIDTTVIYLGEDILQDD